MPQRPPHPYLTPIAYAQPTPVIGHRGAVASAPENTLAGLRAASQLGAAMVEFDVQLSRDGIAVLMHDATVDRTTDGTGAVADLALTDLAKLDAGTRFAPDFAGEPVPTLAAALALCIDLELAANIELKLDGESSLTRQAGAQIAEAAAALWPAGRPPPLLSSFSHAALLGAAAAVPHWPRGCLFSGAPADWPARVHATGAATLNVHHLDDPLGSHDAFLRAGRPVIAYTVNDPAEALALLAKGFTAVISDKPGDILNALATSSAQ